MDLDKQMMMLMSMEWLQIYIVYRLMNDRQRIVFAAWLRSAKRFQFITIYMVCVSLSHRLMPSFFLLRFDRLLYFSDCFTGSTFFLSFSFISKYFFLFLRDFLCTHFSRYFCICYFSVVAVSFISGCFNLFFFSFFSFRFGIKAKNFNNVHESKNSLVKNNFSNSMAFSLK